MGGQCTCCQRENIFISSPVAWVVFAPRATNVSSLRREREERVLASQSNARNLSAPTRFPFPAFYQSKKHRTRASTRISRLFGLSPLVAELTVGGPSPFPCWPIIYTTPLSLFASVLSRLHPPASLTKRRAKFPYYVLLLYLYITWRCHRYKSLSIIYTRSGLSWETASVGSDVVREEETAKKKKTNRWTCFWAASKVCLIFVSNFERHLFHS